MQFNVDLYFTINMVVTIQFNVDLYFAINMVVTIIKTTLTRKQT